MRIVVDIDGTLCPIKGPGESYADLHPLPGAVDRIRELRSAGHYVILQTARSMATCEANLGRVMRSVGKITLDWLDRHGIAYDEIYFGKPNGDVYIDDRALSFRDWEHLTEGVLLGHGKPR